MSPDEPAGMDELRQRVLRLEDQVETLRLVALHTLVLALKASVAQREEGEARDRLVAEVVDLARQLDGVLKDEPFAVPTPEARNG